MKRRKISSQEKKELDGQLKDLREQESRLRIALDNQLKQLESATRNAETAQKRIALDKLSKDFQKIKAIVLTVLNDAGSLQVSDVGVNGGTVVRPGAEDYDTRAAEPLSVKAGRNQQQQQQLQEPQLQMLGESVDEAIALEREREIKQMNQDLLLVNEMMRLGFSFACSYCIMSLNVLLMQRRSQHCQGTGYNGPRNPRLHCRLT